MAAAPQRGLAVTWPNSHERRSPQPSWHLLVSDQSEARQVPSYIELSSSRQPRVRLCTVQSSLRTRTGKRATVRSTKPLELRKAALLSLVQRRVARVALQFGIVRCMLPKSHTPTWQSGATFTGQNKCSKSMVKLLASMLRSSVGSVGRLDLQPPVVVDELLATTPLCATARTQLGHPYFLQSGKRHQ